MAAALIQYPGDALSPVVAINHVQMAAVNPPNVVARL
jgi:hypothetical protein